MEIKKEIYTRTTYSAEEKIKYLPEETVHYDPNMDDQAVKAARPFWNNASVAIRNAVKNPEAPIELMLHSIREDGKITEIRAKASTVIVTRR